MTEVRMGIRRRTTVHIPKSRDRAHGKHLIDRYSVSEGKIWCDCGIWEGPEDEFQAHRKASGAIRSYSRIPSNLGT